MVVLAGGVLAAAVGLIAGSAPSPASAVVVPNSATPTVVTTSPAPSSSSPTTSPPTTGPPTHTPGPTPSPPPVGPPAVRRQWTVYGRSVQGRPLRVLVVGDPVARRKVVVVGCIHGNECAGLPVLDRMAAAGPPPGVVLYLVTSANPDGLAARRRQNARGVDLNRNFPGWRARGRRGDVFWPGRGPLSEPESRALAGLLLRVRPDVLLTYHQAMDVVDDGGGDAALIRRYAAATATRYVRLPRYRGSLATWWHAFAPSATVVTVELPRRVTSARASAHARAALALARGR